MERYRSEMSSRSGREIKRKRKVHSHHFPASSGQSFGSWSIFLIGFWLGYDSLILILKRFRVEFEWCMINPFADWTALGVVKWIWVTFGKKGWGREIERELWRSTGRENLNLTTSPPPLVKQSMFYPFPGWIAGEVPRWDEVKVSRRDRGMARGRERDQRRVRQKKKIEFRNSKWECEQYTHVEES